MLLPRVSELCSKRKCQKFAICQVQAGSAVCVCPKCEEVYVPVCGTDGVTYASNCYLEQAACRLSRNVDFGKDGACGLYFLCIVLL